MLTRRRFLVTAVGFTGGLMALTACSAPAAAPAATSAPAAAGAHDCARGGGTDDRPGRCANHRSGGSRSNHRASRGADHGSGGSPTTAPAAAPTTAPAAAPTTAEAAPSGKVGGSLSYLGFEGDDAPDAAKPFYDKFGVTLGATYLSSSEDILTKMKAGGPGKYDVGTSNTRLIQSLIDQDFLEPLDAEKIPNLKDIYPDFTDEKVVPWAYRDGKLYGIAGYFGLDVINYRADKVSPVPAKWDDLLDSRFKDKIAITDSPVGNLLSVGTAVFGYPPDGTKYTKENLQNVVDWMKKIKLNAKAIVAGYGEVADLMIRGDAWIGFIGWEYISVQGQKAGVDIKHFLANGPLKAWCDAFVVFKGAQNRTVRTPGSTT